MELHLLLLADAAGDYSQLHCCNLAWNQGSRDSESTAQSGITRAGDYQGWGPTHKHPGHSSLTNQKICVPPPRRPPASTTLTHCDVKGVLP